MLTPQRRTGANMVGMFEEASTRLWDVMVGTENNATYYPKDGTAVDCRLYFGGRNRTDTQYSDVDAASIEVYLLESEVGTDLRQGDRIVYNGRTYRIAEAPRSDGYVWDLILIAAPAVA